MIEYRIVNKKGEYIGNGKSQLRWWFVGDFITVQGFKLRIVEVTNHLGRRELTAEIVVVGA